MKGKIFLGFLVVCVSAGFWACSDDSPSISSVGSDDNGQQAANNGQPSNPASSVSGPSYVISSNSAPTSSADVPTPVSSASNPVVSSSAQSQGGGNTITVDNNAPSDPLNANTTYSITISDACTQTLQVSPPQNLGDCKVTYDGEQKDIGWNLQIPDIAGGSSHTVSFSCDGATLKCW